MGIAVGIYDLFAYAVPGVLYLCNLAYLLNRTGSLEVAELLRTPSILLLAATVVASFLIGQATYNIGGLVDRVNPFIPADPKGVAKDRFVARQGILATRPFLGVEMNTLQAAAEMSNREAAAEISRLRAAGLMLRNSTLPLVLGAITAAVELFLTSAKLLASTSATLLLLLGAGCLWHSSKLRMWSLSKTLEICYWIKDIDNEVTSIANFQNPLLEVQAASRPEGGAPTEQPTFVVRVAARLRRKVRMR